MPRFTGQNKKRTNPRYFLNENTLMPMDLSEVRSQTYKFLTYMSKITREFMGSSSAHDGFLRKMGSPSFIEKEKGRDLLFPRVQRVRELAVSEDITSERPDLLKDAVEKMVEAAHELQLDAELSAEYGSFEMSVDGNSRKQREYKAARTFKEQALRIKRTAERAMQGDL